MTNFLAKAIFVFKNFHFSKFKFSFQENERQNYTFQWIWILQERLWVQWMFKNSPAAFFNFQQLQYLMKLNYNQLFLDNKVKIQQQRLDLFIRVYFTKSIRLKGCLRRVWIGNLGHVCQTLYGPETWFGSQTLGCGEVLMFATMIRVSKDWHS